MDTLLASDGVVMIYATEMGSVAERDHRQLRALQRTYVGEWVRLLRTVAPGLTEPQARIAVHAALTIINDLPRTRRVSGRPNLPAELGALAMSVLTAAAG